MKRIYLLRHGRTEANDRHLYCGATDLPLSAGGREALEELRQKGGYPTIERCLVITSGMRRAEETLQALFGETEHAVEADLREVDFGAFEMRGYEELKEDALYQAWCEGDNWRNVPPGGESGAAMADRVLRAFRALAEREGDLLLVIHGGPISAIMAALFPEEGKNMYEWQPRHGTGYGILLDGDKKSWYPIPQGGEKMSEKKRPYWEGKHFAFFQNRECEYFPCHKTDKPEDFNCLFCYCPLYALGDRCGGNFRYTEKGFKDCTNCMVPHVRENYGRILDKYPLIGELASRRSEGEKKTD